MNYNDVSLDVLKNLKIAKELWGSATSETERKQASLLGDKIRAEAGIKAGSDGIFSLKQLNDLIDYREKSNLPNVNTPIVTEEKNNIGADIDNYGDKLAQTTTKVFEGLNNSIKTLFVMPEEKKEVYGPVNPNEKNNGGGVELEGLPYIIGGGVLLALIIKKLF